MCNLAHDNSTGNCLLLALPSSLSLGQVHAPALVACLGELSVFKASRSSLCLGHSKHVTRRQAGTYKAQALLVMSAADVMWTQ